MWQLILLHFTSEFSQDTICSHWKRWCSYIGSRAMESKSMLKRALFQYKAPCVNFYTCSSHVSHLSGSMVELETLVSTCGVYSSILCPAGCGGHISEPPWSMMAFARCITLVRIALEWTYTASSATHTHTHTMTQFTPQTRHHIIQTVAVSSNTGYIWG